MSKATLYLDDPIHKALRLKAAETRQSMSELVNDALRASLHEDLEDIQDWRERKNEPTLSFEDFVKQLKADGVL
ncbi:ribbon-helix-helix protein, CopG family [Haloferula chungangensis]|uniref:Ribbon-helix-helix protein, CopG family n=1 Tax=Haloferula chungangensis TaxID=1048331 RepID=A0ABW2L2D4_9BACT